MTNYKKISRNIRLMFAALVLTVLAFGMVAELDIAPIEGALVDVIDAKMMYVLEVAVLFLTGISILVALKGGDSMLKAWVYATEGKEREKRYAQCYFFRLGLMGIPMFMGAFFYYALLENWGMYCSLAGFVASLYCLPSAEGVEIELGMAEQLQEGSEDSTQNKKN